MYYINNNSTLESTVSCYLSWKDNSELNKLESRRVLLKKDIENPNYDYLSSGSAKWGQDLTTFGMED